MQKVVFSLILSVLAIGVGIVAICVSLDAFSLSNTAYLGWIIAILSTLVLALIGWQVYSLIDFKEQQKSLKPTIDAFNHLMQSNNLLTAKALSDFYYQIITDDKRNLGFNFINNTLLSIMYANEMNDFECSKTLVRYMLEIVVRPENITFNKTQNDVIFGIVSRIRNGDKIEKYSELLRVLLKINVSDAAI